MTSKSRQRRRPLSWLLLALNLACLPGCAREQVVRACPPAIPLTRQAIDGYAACPANPAFDDYMDKIERQQELLEAR